MKHLKTFESFSINETMDMMTLPVDPISGSIDVYSEVFKSIGNKINDIVNPLKRVALSDVVKIKGFMIKTFGTTSPKLSKENEPVIYNAIKSDSDKSIFDYFSKKLGDFGYSLTELVSRFMKDSYTLERISKNSRQSA